MLYEELSKQIIAAYYTVYNTLGYGFLEKVYENAMMMELSNMGLACKQQQHIDVFYKNGKVGDYFADIIVEDKIIIELKAAEGLVEENEYQLINYLKATEKEIGLLLNFGKKPQFRRKIFTNDRKK